MTKKDITANCQTLFATTGFRRMFSKKEYDVRVYRDWDNNRLVKSVNGKVVATIAVPRNWTDKERGDGRKWTVATVRPSFGFHLSPKVEVVFLDKKMGNVITTEF